MEISNNQSQTMALEGILPTKALVVEQTNNSNSKLESSSKVEEQQKDQQIEKQAKNLHGAVSQINDYVQNLQRNLQFTVDKDTGKDVVTVIDSESKTVIRQIPSEEALKLAKRLAESLEDGVQLINTKV